MKMKIKMPFEHEGKMTPFEWFIGIIASAIMSTLVTAVFIKSGVNPYGVILITLFIFGILSHINYFKNQNRSSVYKQILPIDSIVPGSYSVIEDVFVNTKGGKIISIVEHGKTEPLLFHAPFSRGFSGEYVGKKVKWVDLEGLNSACLNKEEDLLGIVKVEIPE